MVFTRGPVQAQTIDWNKTLQKSAPPVLVTTTENNGSLLNFSYTNPNDPVKGQAAIISTPFQVPVGSTAQGISFEVRGDGSENFAGVMLAQALNRDVASGYEALFPLDSKDWRKVTLRWDDFTQNYLPWNPANVKDDTMPVVDPSKIAWLGFGEGRYFTRFYPKQFSFSVRNVQLVDIVPATSVPVFAEDFSHVKSMLGSGRKIGILLIGDSITDFGNDQNYGFFCGQKIKEKWSNDVVVANGGIRGHSVRGGTIVLPRILRLMPAPDLVCILFGANDSTALGKKKEFNEVVFKAELENLIDKVRIATNGQADVCLLSGVPRLLPDMQTSAGIIEQIDGAVQEAAAEKKTAYIDTFSAYLKLSPDQRKLYYRDTVHQLTPGQEFMGGLVFDQLRAEMTPAK